jgi:SAM-dependent methyltransferase
MTNDPYSSLEYRKLFSWSQRLGREWPLLDEVLGSGPSRRILELGSGTGEHARFLGSRGYSVVAVDSSEAQIAQSREAVQEREPVEFVLGDMRELAKNVDGSFGAAFCVGNALPHVTALEDVEAVARGLRARLGEDAPFLLQILNYERIIGKKERFLPITLTPREDGGESVLVRLMEPRDDGTVIFYPTTMRLVPDAEPPVEILSSRRVELRGWRRAELEEIFGRHGFTRFTAYGGFDRSPFVPLESRDLIFVAR